MAFWDYVKLAALLFCVPAQMWLSQNTAPTDRTNARSFGDGGFGLVKQFKANFGDVSGYLATHLSVMENVRKKLLKKSRTRRGVDEDADDGAEPHAQSVAIEVIRYDYFAASEAPRKDREAPMYRVGQAFRHKQYGYKGVIIGWDARAKAPKEWFERMGVTQAEQLSPMYSVLVDTRDRDEEHSKTYVVEGNIVLIEDPSDAVDYSHSRRAQYFSRFNSRMNTWSPNPRLRRKYPLD